MWGLANACRTGRRDPSFVQDYGWQAPSFVQDYGGQAARCYTDSVQRALIAVNIQTLPRQYLVGAVALNRLPPAEGR